jgi:hypothetical protein
LPSARLEPLAMSRTTEPMPAVATLLVALAMLMSACGGDVPPATTAPASDDAAASESASASALPGPSAVAPSVAPDAAAEWTGPARSRPAGADMIDPDTATRRSFSDPVDADRPYVDIGEVMGEPSSQAHWRFGLVAPPPKAETLDPAQTVISYGLAFETTGDEVPDYIVGISNDALPAGAYRVWVTNVETGHTHEKEGGPYGIPIEFSHPDEIPPGDVLEQAMVFTFLPGSRPAGLSSSARFYAWASVEEDGEVVAWDYAPDAGWIGSEAGAQAPEPDAGAPVAGGDQADARFPECAVDAFAFAGEGTLRQLGLDKATPVPPPDIDRVAMIRVTRDPVPHDLGEPGGAVEMVRMLCFEFADGSGGSGWPVDAAWRAPAEFTSASESAPSDGLPTAALGAAVAAIVLLVLSAFAFRSRPLRDH